MKVRFALRDRDKGWRKLRRLARQQRLSVDVGLPADEEARPGFSMADLGLVHEFGSSDGRIPERSWLRRAFDRNQGRLTLRVEQLAGQVLDGRITVRRAMEILGETLAQMARDQIARFSPIPPPNTPEVAARKAARGGPGVGRTLVDTGAMFSAIAWRIVRGGPG